MLAKAVLGSVLCLAFTGTAMAGYARCNERVWVPPRERQVFHPAEYEYRWDSCQRRKVRVLVSPAHYDTVIEPGYWETRRVRVQQRCHTRGIHFRF